MRDRGDRRNRKNYARNLGTPLPKSRAGVGIEFSSAEIVRDRRYSPEPALANRVFPEPSRSGEYTIRLASKNSLENYGNTGLL